MTTTQKSIAADILRLAAAILDATNKKKPKKP